MSITIYEFKEKLRLLEYSIKKNLLKFYFWGSWGKE